MWNRFWTRWFENKLGYAYTTLGKIMRVIFFFTIIVSGAICIISFIQRGISDYQAMLFAALTLLLANYNKSVKTSALVRRIKELMSKEIKED